MNLCLVPCKQFLVFLCQVSDCYVQLNDWESALEWQEAYTKLRADSIHNLPQPIYAVDLCFLKYIYL